jgi:hypothetical protein
MPNNIPIKIPEIKPIFPRFQNPNFSLSTQKQKPKNQKSKPNTHMKKEVKNKTLTLKLQNKVKGK